MLKSNRYIALSIIVGLLTVVVLIMLYRHLSYTALLKHETLSNVTLTQTFANSIWPRYAQSVSNAAKTTDKDPVIRFEIASLRREVLKQMHRTRVLRVKIYNLDGLVVFSTKTSQIGDQQSQNAGFISARSGKAISSITFRGRFDSFDGEIVDRNLISSYVPIYKEDSNEVTAVCEVYTDVTDLINSMEPVQWYIIFGVLGSLLVLHIVLLAIVGRANRTIKRQQRRNIEQEAKFNFHAYHDALTSLPNRSSFVTQVGKSVEQARQNSKILGVLLLDLNNFKLINDSFGHYTGDYVIAVIAERLSSVVRQSDSLFRIGGDQFAVVLEDLDRPEGAIHFVGRIIELMTRPINVNNQSIIVTSNMGISVYPRDTENAELLVKNADAALHISKQSGRNRYEFYSPEMNRRALEQLALESDLQRAVNKKEFMLHYQPRLSGRDHSIVATEALVRWRHPEKGFIPSEKFVPILEQIGAIESIGEWTLYSACRQNKAWQDEGLPPMRVSVNISYIQFRSGHLVETVKEVLKETKLSAEYLELELTESVLMDNTETVIDTLTQLKNLGVSIAIDDFGTGFSSLNYLRRLPIDLIKIDRSFIREIQTNKKDEIIVSAILKLARGLGIRVVAEGIELQQQEKILLYHKCDELQGFLYSPAIPLEEIRELVANSPFSKYKASSASL
ncbi:putative bifunctional diguanylate cyclase/phosphodiesterase [Pseudomonadota bacterium]